VENSNPLYVYITVKRDKKQVDYTKKFLFLYLKRTRSRNLRTKKTECIFEIHSVYFRSGSPQQQPHATSFLPVRAALIIAEAQPTPLVTVMAPAAQFTWQAPHSIQLVGLMIRAL
jgi:hypothetical protein